MVTVASLWLPILVSAALVFVASALIHTVLGYHKRDFAGVPEEDRIMEALRDADVSGGDYVIPHADDAEERKSPEFLEKARRGPVAFLTVVDDWSPAMGAQFVQWFVYCVVVGIFAAYVAGRALEPGAEYLAVFRFAGSVAFVGYGLALWQDSIWYNRAWSTTAKNTLDAAVYGLLTAGVFGWLWPA